MLPIIVLFLLIVILYVFGLVATLENCKNVGVRERKKERGKKK
jgi:hypothetical protein